MTKMFNLELLKKNINGLIEAEGVKRYKVEEECNLYSAFLTKFLSSKNVQTKDDVEGKKYIMPNLQQLLNIAARFNVNLEMLLTKDLTKCSKEELFLTNFIGRLINKDLQWEEMTPDYMANSAVDYYEMDLAYTYQDLEEGNFDAEANELLGNLGIEMPTEKYDFDDPEYYETIYEDHSRIYSRDEHKPLLLDNVYSKDGCRISPDLLFRSPFHSVSCNLVDNVYLTKIGDEKYLYLVKLNCQGSISYELYMENRTYTDKIKLETNNEYEIELYCYEREWKPICTSLYKYKAGIGELMEQLYKEANNKIHQPTLDDDFMKELNGLLLQH